MSEWDCGGVDPLPGVPRVRIVDPDGRELFEGYYIRHENRQPAVFGGTDRLRPEDVDHCVAVDGFADWNMPRSLVIKKVTPPHRIEVVGPVPGYVCELVGDGMPEGEPLPPIVDREALLALADEMDHWALTCDHYDRQVSPLDVTKYARRIRESCGEAANGVPTGRRVSGRVEGSGPQAGGPSGPRCAGARAEKN